MKMLEQLLNETQLNVTELMKPNSSTGEARANILLRMIANGEKVTLKDNSKAVIDPRQSNQDALRALAAGDYDSINAVFGQRGNASLVFMTTDGTPLALSHIKKSPEFGGGASGAGAGAVTTTAAESATAVAMAIAAINGGTLTADMLTPQNIRKARPRFEVKASMDQLINIMSDKGWAATFVNSANALFKSFPAAVRMNFHHQTSWVKALMDTFNHCNKGSKRYFSKIDKWNPADIWALAPDAPYPSIDELHNLPELKGWMQEQFENGKVYGLSLKKAPKSATAKVINYDESADELLDLTIQDLLVSKTNKLFGSKDSYIVYESERNDFLLDLLAEKEVQFRSFSGDDPIQAELKGKHAAHGKLGHGPINNILSGLGLPEMTARNDIFRMKRDKGLDYVLKMIVRNARKVNPQIANQAAKNLSEIATDMTNQVLISKYQAVELLAIVKQGTPEQKEDFIQELIGFASSRSKLSSVYIKIS